MTSYIREYKQSTVAKGRNALIQSLSDIYDMTPHDCEIEAIVDHLLLSDYLSTTFFESVEEEA